MENVIDKEKSVSKEEKKQPKQPPKYGVILNNCDYSEMMCVRDSLALTFSMTEAEAMDKMFTAHSKGCVYINTYPSKDLAESKAAQANDTNKQLHIEKGLDEPSHIYRVEKMED